MHAQCRLALADGTCNVFEIVVMRCRTLAIRISCGVPSDAPHLLSRRARASLQVATGRQLSFYHRALPRSVRSNSLCARNAVSLVRFASSAITSLLTRSVWSFPFSSSLPSPSLLHPFALHAHESSDARQARLHKEHTLQPGLLWTI